MFFSGDTSDLSTVSCRVKRWSPCTTIGDDAGNDNDELLSYIDERTFPVNLSETRTSLVGRKLIDYQSCSDDSFLPRLGWRQYLRAVFDDLQQEAFCYSKGER